MERNKSKALKKLRNTNLNHVVSQQISLHVFESFDTHTDWKVLSCEKETWRPPSKQASKACLMPNVSFLKVNIEIQG